MNSGLTAESEEQSKIPELPSKAPKVALVLGAGALAPGMDGLLGSSSPLRIPLNETTLGHVLITRESSWSDLVVAVGSDEDSISHLVKTSSEKVLLSVVPSAASWIQTLSQATSQIKHEDYELRIVFADALLSEMNGDSILVGEIDARHEWTYVNRDDSGFLSVDSIARESCVGSFAGAMNFSRGRRFAEIVSKICSPSVSWIRSFNLALQIYQAELGSPILAVKDDLVIDLGSVKAFNDYRAKALAGRVHNSFHSDSGWITKVSSDAQKLIQERDWFVNLPEELRGFIPRVAMQPGAASAAASQGSYKIQYFEGLPFSDFVLWSSNATPALEAWEKFIQLWLKVSDEFTAEGPDLSMIEHLRKRFSKVMSYHRELDHYSTDELGRTYESFENLLLKLGGSQQLSIIHGDLVFSNTLLKLDDGAGKLIDPRGGFSGPSLFGDKMYEWGKIAQSIFGRYESILSGDYSQNGMELLFEYDSLRAASYRHLEQWFFKECPNANAAIQLGGILMLCAVPFHSERPDRQLALSQVGKTLALGEGL